MGEYAILETGRALLLTHAPCFEAETTVSSGTGGSTGSEAKGFASTEAKGFASTEAKGFASTEAKSFAGGSPAGKLGAEFKHQISFIDPYNGRGGFGGSGAEFLAVYFAAHPGGDAWGAWDAYRRLGCSGSGADILAQASAVNQLVALDLPARNLRTYPLGKMNLEIHLFHTGRKLPTHEHLEEGKRPPCAKLDEVVTSCLQAYANGNATAFAGAIEAYGKILAEAGFLAKHSALALADLPRAGVLAAKGCGALGNDVLLLLTEKDFSPPRPWIEKHSLVEVVTLPI